MSVAAQRRKILAHTFDRVVQNLDQIQNSLTAHACAFDHTKIDMAKNAIRYGDCRIRRTTGISLPSILQQSLDLFHDLRLRTGAFCRAIEKAIHLARDVGEITMKLLLIGIGFRDSCSFHLPRFRSSVPK
jgi:hypothetical protein